MDQVAEAMVAVTLCFGAVMAILAAYQWATAAVRRWERTGKA